MVHQNVAATYVLTDSEKSDVERIVRSKVPLYQPEAYEAFMAGCREAANELPANIHYWKDQAEIQDIGLIHNLPIDTLLPKTPTVKHAADSISMLADGVIGTVSALFGIVYTIEGKGSGRHIHNLYPVVGDEYTQLGSSSQVELEWHVEEAFHPARPNWLNLLCLRSDVEAITKIARARDLILEPDILRTLTEHRFNLRIDETYSSVGSSTSITTSVLAGSSTDPEIVLDPAYTIFQDEIEYRAVAAVGNAAELAHLRFTLVEGDLLVLNNRRVIHGRSAFRPRMDGTDRWLKRAYVIEGSKWASKLNNGRVPIQID